MASAKPNAGGLITDCKCGNGESSRLMDTDLLRVRRRPRSAAHASERHALRGDRPLRGWDGAGAASASASGGARANAMDYLFKDSSATKIWWRATVEGNTANLLKEIDSALPVFRLFGERLPPSFVATGIPEEDDGDGRPGPRRTPLFNAYCFAHDGVAMHDPRVPMPHEPAASDNIYNDGRSHLFDGVDQQLPGVFNLHDVRRAHGDRMERQLRLTHSILLDEFNTSMLAQFADAAAAPFPNQEAIEIVGLVQVPHLNGSRVNVIAISGKGSRGRIVVEIEGEEGVRHRKKLKHCNLAFVDRDRESVSGERSEIKFAAWVEEHREVVSAKARSCRNCRMSVSAAGDR